MQIIFVGRAKKSFKRLPSRIKEKAYKQIALLDINIKHPSLRVKKMADSNKLEARIDRHYRFVFEVKDSFFIIYSIGPHDEGLGKK